MTMAEAKTESNTDGRTGDVPVAAVRTRGLTRTFGDLVAVNNLDLEITPGTIHGFLGPNGCGKTTAIRMLTGLLTPSSGSAEVLGLALPENAEKLKYRIGYMTQTFSLYRDLTVRENLAFVAKIFGLGFPEQKKRIDELLSLYNLDTLSAKRAGKMSGGQRQRLALAAAVLHKPDLLILDEPTSAVDPESRREFWEQLFDLSDLGTSIIVTTHFMDEAERCHEISILEAGEKRASGAPNDLMNSLGANVLEVEGRDLRPLRKALTDRSEVISAAQIGARLRVLVREQVGDPELWMKSLPETQDIGSIRKVRPNLEDVFVANTGSGRQ
ncbi:ABC transporter ATP-binding protein [Labrenzia sp. CE80]|uniref:ABC transporter ATP-binding protein n=1 Tax=Labrenzia sp. CE80 TaxID=1788986 RepID=UPI00129BE6F5|nr:ABC transporter ATP-binding protein [Labrenzia sp. CE80]